MAENDPPETAEEKAIRVDASRRAMAVIESLPLLGSGNKFVKTEAHTMAVCLAVANGIPRDRIAARLGISKRTLELHFDAELHHAKEYLQDACDGTAMVAIYRARYDSKFAPLAKLVMAKFGGYSDKIQQDNISSDGSMSPEQPPLTVVPQNGRARQRRTGEPTEAVTIDGQVLPDPPPPQKTPKKAATKPAKPAPKYPPVPKGEKRGKPPHTGRKRLTKTPAQLAKKNATTAPKK